MQELATEIVRLQGELDREIEARRKVLGWEFKRGVVEFDQGITMVHRQLRVGMTKFLARSPIATMLVAPVIYSMVLPILLVDAWASLYQAICFRVYRIPQVRRSDYVVFDRQRLAYLNWIETINCVYCDYGNGAIAYVREIASRTEQYWCPIKHALKITDPHQRYYQFLEYGDADGYRARLDQFRDQLRTDPKQDAKPAKKP
jgi:hypothetical protein